MSNYCGVKKRQGEGTCRRPAGWGTNHVGTGACKLHGGCGGVLKHGRYSKVNRVRLGNLIAEYEDDPDPLNVLPELAAARALFVDFIERYDTWREALLAWHASFNESDNPKPREVLDVSDARRLLADVVKMAQGEKKLMLDNAISRKELLRIFTEQRRVIESVCDAETVNRILKGFNDIRLA